MSVITDPAGGSTPGAVVPCSWLCAGNQSSVLLWRHLTSEDGSAAGEDKRLPVLCSQAGQSEEALGRGTPAVLCPFCMGSL